MAVLTWRPMTVDDLDAVANIAMIGFPDHFEGYDCFENRLALYPRGCFVLADAEATPLGYLIAYPWKADAAPILNTRIDALPGDAALIYLHDLALHPDARGGGHSRTIVERLATQAKADGWSSLALVAVNDAASFWAGHGFHSRDTPQMTTKLASYGPDARYMVRSL